MAKLVLENMITSQGSNTNPYPVVDRFTKATLPARGTLNKVVFVTDGTFGPSLGAGSAYVGGGTFLNALLWTGIAYITI